MKSRKKIIMVFFLFNVFSSLLIGAAEKEITLNNGTNLFRNKTLGNYKIINIDGIDYMNISDLKNLISKVYKITKFSENSKTIIWGSVDDKFTIRIDRKNNTVRKYDKNMQYLKKINSFPVVPNKVMARAFKEKKFHRLDSFGVEIIDEKYFPIVLIGKIFFENILQIYKNPEGKYYLLDETIYNENLPGRDERWLIQNVSPSGKIERKLSEFTLKYLFSILRDDYAGYTRKNVNINVLQKKYFKKLNKIKFKFQFNYLLMELLNEIRDSHIRIMTATIPSSLRNFNSPLKGNQRSFSLKSIDDDILYLDIPTFLKKFKIGEKYFKDYKTEILSSKNIIINLRDNLGGNHPMDEILSSISNKDLTLYSKVKNDIVLSRKIPGKSLNKKNIIVLINRGSYSMATNFSGNIKLNKIGILMGEKTSGGGFDRGKPFILPDNNVVAIPISAHITDAKGNDFEDGVKPDVYVEDKIENGKDLILEKAIEYLKRKNR